MILLNSLTFFAFAVSRTEKTCKCLGPPRRCATKELGNDILTSAVTSDKHVHEMDNGSFYHFVVLLSTTSNHSRKLKCCNRSSSHIKFRGNRLCWIVLSEHLTCLTTKYQHTFASKQMPFNYPSFDKHFYSLSRHDKTSVFLHIRVEVRECRNQIDTKYTTKTLSIA